MVVVINNDEVKIGINQQKPAKINKNTIKKVIK